MTHLRGIGFVEFVAPNEARRQRKQSRGRGDPARPCHDCVAELAEGPESPNDTSALAGQGPLATSISAVSGGRTVTISSGPMSMEELLELARGAPCELDASALAVIDDSRAVIDAVLATGKPVYGLNTGLGHAKDTRLEPDEIRAFQMTMLRGHAGAMGPPLRTELVRAAMAARVNGMARGGSGASRACATTLVSMLNAGVHPVVPGFGSVGAGDLAQLAAIALVAIGEGRAELKGEAVSGAVALERAGISPLQLEPKDALSLMSHNGVSIGNGALVVARAKRALEAADIAAALSLESMSGNTSAFDPVVAAAKGIRGQAEVSAHICGLVDGSSALDPSTERTILCLSESCPRFTERSGSSSSSRAPRWRPS
jgi:histidine ammonia-lyase